MRDRQVFCTVAKVGHRSSVHVASDGGGKHPACDLVGFWWISRGMVHPPIVNIPNPIFRVFFRRCHFDDVQFLQSRDCKLSQEPVLRA